MTNFHVFIADIGAILLIVVNLLVFVSRSNKIEHRLTALETSMQHVSKQVDKIK